MRTEDILRDGRREFATKTPSTAVPGSRPYAGAQGGALHLPSPRISSITAFVMKPIFLVRARPVEHDSATP